MRSLIKYLKSESFCYLMYCCIIYFLIHIFHFLFFRYLYFYNNIKMVIIILSLFYVFYYIFFDLKIINIKSINIKLNYNIKLKKSIFIFKKKKLMKIFIKIILIDLFLVLILSILFETANYDLNFLLVNKHIKNMDKTDFKNLYVISKVDSTLKGYFQKNYYSIDIIGIGYLQDNNIFIKDNNLFVNKFKIIKLFDKKVEKRLYISGNNFIKKGDIFIFKYDPFIIKSRYIDFNHYNGGKDIIFIEKKENNVFFKIRERLFKYLIKRLNKWNATFLYSLLTGDRRFLNKYLLNLYQRNQTSHLLALSGLHIGIIVNFIFIVLSRFIYNRKIIYIIISIFVFIFGMFVEFPHSVVRAIVMFIFIVLVLFFDRKLNPFKFIFTVIIFSFLFIGENISGISFMLSISAIYSIFIIFSAIKMYFNKVIKFRNFIFDLFLVSFSITFFQTFFIIYYFNKSNVISFIINPLVIIIATIAVYLAIGGIIIPFLSNLFFLLSEIFLDLSHFINIIFSKITENFSIFCLNIDRYFFIIIFLVVFLTSYIYFSIEKKMLLHYN